MTGEAHIIKFSDWCDFENVSVGPHQRSVMTARPNHVGGGVKLTAAVVPEHYVSLSRFASALQRLGKPASAMLVDRLPTSTTMRSGDLGEIMATAWIDELSENYYVPIRRLRWKDHREMASRGEDAIGIRVRADSEKLEFLKTEAKSRAQLTRQVLEAARMSLDKDDGKPSPHALVLLSDQLCSSEQGELAALVLDALYKHGISQSDVKHLTFTFSGNSPSKLLDSAILAYSGSIPQLAVGLTVKRHALFIDDVFKQVIDNASDA